jgi:hypothetical protein
VRGIFEGSKFERACEKGLVYAVENTGDQPWGLLISLESLSNMSVVIEPVVLNREMIDTEEWAPVQPVIQHRRYVLSPVPMPKYNSSQLSLGSC